MRKRAVWPICPSAALPPIGIDDAEVRPDGCPPPCQGGQRGVRLTMEQKPIPRVVSVNLSPGGVPKCAVNEAQVTTDGLVGDGHAHAKHIKPTRAISLLDEEIIVSLRTEQYPVAPGVLGENITVRDLHVQGLSPGTRLCFSGGVVMELVEPRKPCFVLNAVHPALEKETIGRIGYMARVLSDGIIRPGESITVISEPFL